MATTTMLGRRSRIGLAFVLLTAVVVVTSATSPSAAEPLALTDGFELDGDPTAGSAPGDDWDLVWLDATGSASTTQSSAAATVFLTDQLPGDDDTIAGGRDTEPLSEWSWRSGRASGKTDVQHLFAATYEAGGGRTYLYAGLDRTATEGAASAGFWFFRDDVSLLPDGSVGGEHQAGDLLVLVSFAQGGRVERVDVYRWVGAGGTHDTLDLVASGAECGTPGAGEVCAITNATTPVTVPWPFEGRRGEPGVVDTQGLIEVGVDLTNLLDPVAGCFSTFAAGTRTSKQLDSSLADIVLGQFGLCSASVDVSGTALSKVGDPATSSITLRNTGSFPLSLVSLTDSALGDLLAPTSGVTVTGTCPATLAAGGGGCTLDLQFTVPSTAPDPFTRTVTAGFAAAGNTGDTVTASGSHTMELFQPALELTASGPPSGRPGDPVVVDVALRNTGSVDSPPLACSVGSSTGFATTTTVATSGVARWSLPTTLPSSGGPSFDVALTATCSPSGFPNVLTDEASVTILVPRDVIRGLVVTPATVDVGTVVVPGTVAATVTVTNTGEIAEELTNLTLTGDTTLAVLTDGCTETTLAAGASCSLTVTFTPAGPGSSAATLTVTALSGIEATGRFGGTGQVEIPPPVVALAKTGPATAVAGDEIEYRLVLTDLSPAAAASPLSCTVTDELLGFTDTVTLDRGVPSSWVVSYTVPATARGPLTNVALATCTAPDVEGTVGDAVAWSVDVLPPPVRAVTIAPDPIDFGTVVVPGSLDQHVTVTNTGDTDEAIETLVLAGDPAFTLVADGCTGADLVPGASCHATVAFAPPASGTVVATLTATTESGPTDVVDVTGTGLYVPPPTPAVALTKTAPATALAGADVTYSFVAENTGELPLTCRLYDATLGLDGAGPLTLPVSSSTSLGLVGSLPVGVTGPLTNVASVRCLADGVEGLVSDTAQATVTALAPPARGLLVTPVVVDAGLVVLGSTVTVQATVTNIGEQPETLGTLTLESPTGAFALAAGCAAGSELPVGGTCTVTLTFAPPTAGTHPATIVATSADSNVSATATLTGRAEDVPPPTPRVTLDKSAAAAVVAGEELAYDFIVTNTSDNGVGALVCALDDPALGLTSAFALDEGASLSLTETTRPSTAGQLVNIATVRCKATGVTALVGATDAATVTVVPGPTRSLTLEPGLIDLGTVLLGGSAATQVTVRNTGQATETVDLVTLNGPGPFTAIGCPSGTVLAPGASCSLTIVFTPTATGPASTTLTVTTLAGTTGAVGITGTGEVLAPPLVVQLSKTGPATGAAGATISYAFAVLDASEAGTAGPLSCTLFDPFLGYTSGPFELVRGSASTFSVTAALPSTPGSFLNVAWVSCTAEGTAPTGAFAVWTVTVEPAPPTRSLVVQPPQITLGPIVLPSTSATQVVVTNTGGATETITSVTVTGPATTPFSTTGCTPPELGPGASCTITLTYKPTDPGTHVATLTVTTAASTTTTATLTGTAITVTPEAPTVSLTKTAPATATVGSTITYLLSATNTSGSDAPGPLECRVSDPLLGYTSPATFIIGIGATHDATAALATSDTTPDPVVNTATVTCTVPTTVGLVTATATATTDLVLHALDVDDVTFGTLVVGSSAASAVVVRNTGRETETGLRVELTQNATAYTLGTDSCATATLAPGQTCQVTLTFAPGATQTYPATVTVTSDTDAIATAAITGTGLVVTPTPRVSLTKTAPATATAGSTISYRFVATNTSDTGAGPLACQLDDPLLGLDDTWAILLDSTGATASLTVDHATDPALVGPLTNTATISCLISGVAVSDTASATTVLTPPTRSLTLEPTSADVGDVLIGTSASTVLVVRNSGEVPETVDTVTVGDPTRFSVAGCAGTGLLPGGTCQILVTFTPTGEGPSTTTVTVVTATKTTGSATVTGTGVTVPPPAPSVTLTKSGPATAVRGATIDFVVTAAASATTTLSCGLVDPLLDVSAGVVLVPGQTWTTTYPYQIPFSAPATLVNTAAVTCLVPGASIGATAQATVSVTDPVRRLVLDVTDVDLGEVVVGSEVATAVVVRNLGQVNEEITSATTDPSAPISTPDGCLPGATLQPGGSCTIVARFAPTAAGSYTATLTVTSAASTTVTGTLQGTATAVDPAPAVQLQKTAPATVVRGGTVTYGFTVLGGVAGTAPPLTCRLLDPAVGLTGASTFSLTPGFPYAAPDVTLTVAGDAPDLLVNVAWVICTVPGQRAVVGDVAIARVGIVEPPVSRLAIEPATIDLGDVLVPGSVVRAGSVVNTGDQVEVVNELALNPVGGLPNDGLVLDPGSCVGTQLAPKASCGFSVRFTPTSAGERGAVVLATARSKASATASVRGRASIPLPSPVSITVSKSVEPSTARPGDAVTFRLEVANTSGANAPGPLSCRFDDALLGITARSLGTVASGQRAAVTLPYTIPAAAEGTIVNTASVTCGVLGAPEVSGTATATVGVVTPQRQLTLEPSPVDFGTVLIGGQDARVVRLTNRGGQVETITGIAVTGERAALSSLGRTRLARQVSTSPWFSVLAPDPVGECTVGLALAAGASCNVSVLFAPDAVGRRTADLVVTSAGRRATAALSGGGATNPGLSVELSKTGPATAVVGQRVSYRFTMTNTSTVTTPLACMLSDPIAGVEQRLTLARGQSATADAALTVPSGSPDPLVNLATLRCGTPDAPGGARDVATWSIDLQSPPTAPLRLSITPATAAFGDVVLGSSAVTTFTVRNESRSGNRIASVSVADATGPGYAVLDDACTGRTLAAAGTCTLRVRFTPAAPTPVTARVVVAGSGGSSAAAALSGGGALAASPVRAFVITPAVVDFTSTGPAAIASLSPPVTLEVRNIGTDPERVSALSLSGPGAAAFALVADACTGIELASNGSCLVSARFAPTQPGSTSATLIATGTAGSSATASLLGAATFRPTVVFNPAVVAVGRVTTLFGRGFPANSLVTIRWTPGPITTVTDSTGSFAVPVFVGHHDEHLPHLAVVDAVPGFYGELNAPLLVQAAPFRPMGLASPFYGQDQSLVSRS